MTGCSSFFDEWRWEFHSNYLGDQADRQIGTYITQIYFCASRSQDSYWRISLPQTDASSLRLREFEFLEVMVEIEGRRRTHLRKECATKAYRDRFHTLPLRKVVRVCTSTIHVHQRYAASGPWKWTKASNLKRLVRDSHFCGGSCCCASDVRKRPNRSCWISGRTYVEYTNTKRSSRMPSYLAQIYKFQLS